MDPEIKIVKTTLLIKNLSKYSSEYKYNRVSPSCFEIPVPLYNELLAKIGSEARIDRYLNKILNKFRIICYSGQLEKFDGAKLKYQDKNQDFERADFKPFSGDWIELRILSAMHGMTMTRFFVMLLALDLGDFGEAMEFAMRGVDPTMLLRNPIKYTQTLHRTKGKLTKFIRFGVQIHDFFEIDSCDDRRTASNEIFS